MFPTLGKTAQRGRAAIDGRQELSGFGPVNEGRSDTSS